MNHKKSSVTEVQEDSSHALQYFHDEQELPDHHGHHHHSHEHHVHAERKLKRLFERGDLQLLILARLQKSESHGYELIKSIKTLSHGIYEPSPGVVYPTLSMLEDQGFITQDNEKKGKKVFKITSDGLDYLQQSESKMAILKERLASIGQVKDKIDFSDKISEAIKNFKMLIRHQVRHDQLSSAQIEKIVNIINTATQEIEKVNLVIAAAPEE